VAGEKTSALGFVPEVRQQTVRYRAGLIEIPSMSGRLECVEQGDRQPRRIIKIAVEAPAMPGHSPAHPAFGECIIQKKGERLFRSSSIRRDAERPGGIK